MVERRNITKNGVTKRRPTYSMRIRMSGLNYRPVFQLYKSKAASEAFERKVHRLMDSVRGGEALSAEMLHWISCLEERHKKKLVKLGLLDPKRIASVESLEVHVKQWEETLDAKGLTDDHVGATVGNVRRVFEKCGIARWVDIDSDEIQKYLKAQCGPEGWGARHHNAHVQSLRQFGKWMVGKKLAPEDLLASVMRRSEGSEAPRRIRRAATHDEARTLLETTRASGVNYGRCGPEERALIYWSAVYTGFRHDELRELEVRSLKWRQGDEAGDQPGYILPDIHETKAGKKTGRRDLVVLHPELEDALRAWTSSSIATARVFPNMRKDRGAEMLKLDLERAEIPYVDEAGETLDFHALRHSYGTWIGLNGTDITTHKDMMRHSSVQLTMRYSHAQMMGRKLAIGEMPRMSSESPDVPEPNSQAAPLAQAAGGETGVPQGVPQPFLLQAQPGMHMHPRPPLRACDVLSDRFKIRFPQGSEGSSPSFGIRHEQVPNGQGPDGREAGSGTQGAASFEHGASSHLKGADTPGVPQRVPHPLGSIDSPSHAPSPESESSAVEDPLVDLPEARAHVDDCAELCDAIPRLDRDHLVGLALLLAENIDALPEDARAKILDKARKGRDA